MVIVKDAVPHTFWCNHIILTPYRKMTREHFSTWKIETEAVNTLLFPLKFESHCTNLILKTSQHYTI